MRNVKIKTDQRRIYQVLANLLSNALQYTVEGSIILSIDLQETTLKFQVIDTGIGIKDEIKPHLFKLVNQMRDNPNNTGKGLGLTLSKRIIERLGGEIKLSS